MVDFAKGATPRFHGGLRWLMIIAALGAVVGIGMQYGRWLRTRSTTDNSGGASSVGVSDRKVPDAQSVSLTAAAAIRGEIVFQLHCAKCHGPEGHGEPEAMERMRPPPRDFASRPWRFGVDVDSIRRVIVEGIPETSMPAFRLTLSPSELDAVVLHTRQLATGEPVVPRHQSPLDMALAGANFVRESKTRDAPELKISDAKGRTRTLSAERGRVVLLNFWGTSCEHCLAGMPKLQALADRWESRGLTVLNICADSEDAGEAQRLVDRISPTTRVWVDESGLANSLFDVQVMPTIWLIDPEGRMVASARGMQEWSAPIIDELLKLHIQESSTVPKDGL